MSKDPKKTKAKKTDEKTDAKKTDAKKPATKKPAPKKDTDSKPVKKEAAPKKEDKPAKKDSDIKPENTIFVGNKPPITYVLAVMTCFNEKNAKEVKICARGRAISSAVDVAELTKNRFMSEVKVKKITTSTEQVTRREGGGEANVSAIEIILAK